VNIKKSKFDSNHTLIFLDKEDEKYSELLPAFKKHGLAFKHGNFIFFDVPSLKKNGYFGKTHLTFIEAHEIAHSVLGHTKSTRYNEAEADFLATLLCRKRNYKKSEELGIDEFYARNNIKYSDFSNKYKEKILSKIKIK